jgi:hypothetical protein
MYVKSKETPTPIKKAPLLISSYESPLLGAQVGAGSLYQDAAIQ